MESHWEAWSRGMTGSFSVFFFLIYLFIYLDTPDLSCSMCDLVSWPGIEPGPPDLEAWSLSHWTARKVTSLIVSKEHQLLCGDWMRIQARVKNGSSQELQGVPSRASSRTPSSTCPGTLAAYPVDLFVLHCQSALHPGFKNHFQKGKILTLGKHKRNISQRFYLTHWLMRGPVRYCGLLKNCPRSKDTYRWFDKEMLGVVY